MALGMLVECSRVRTGHAILIDSVPTFLATILTLTKLVQNDKRTFEQYFASRLVKLSLFLDNSLGNIWMRKPV